MMDHEHPTTAHHHDDTSDASGQTDMDGCSSMDQHSGHGMMMMVRNPPSVCLFKLLFTK
jgi:hypothetical protein